MRVRVAQDPHSVILNGPATLRYPEYTPNFVGSKPGNAVTRSFAGAAVAVATMAAAAKAFESTISLNWRKTHVYEWYLACCPHLRSFCVGARAPRPARARSAP